MIESANINGPRDVAFWERTPSDPESDPKCLEAMHRQEVKEAVESGITDPAALSELLCLPLWNIERALHWLATASFLQASAGFRQDARPLQ